MIESFLVVSGFFVVCYWVIAFFVSIAWTLLTLLAYAGLAVLAGVVILVEWVVKLFRPTSRPTMPSTPDGGRR